MSVAIERHDRLIEDIVGRHSGILLKTKGEGDSTFSVFARASDAVHAAMELQLAVSSEPWPEGAELRLRAAMHTGEVDLRDGDYFGPAVNRSARLRSTAHGGQTLLTQSTSELVLGHLPKGATLASLGSHRLKDLEEPEHIYQLNHSSLPSRFPSLRSLDYMPTNLPIQVTTFVGRDREMLELKELLPTTRILTITGAGGAGKTRLAVQVAAELLDAFPNGVWFADFAPLVEARLVPYIVAGILGLRENVDETADGAPLQAPSEDITPRMIDHLRDSQVLLILDNCEHVLSACTDLAAHLTQSCPRVSIITTSREPLGVAGELTWRIPSLAMPDPEETPSVEALSQYEAVRLFIERALSVRPDFTVDKENAPAIAQICYRLDGIPLAIELAAARVNVLTPDQIAARLEDRFRLLTGGTRTALPRQQTLQALADWSYQLLNNEEQGLLRRMSVFFGGFSIEAAEDICSGEEIEPQQILDLLTQLVDKSLLIAEVGGESARYRLNETMRQYGLNKLIAAGEAETFRIRHRDWFLELAERLELLLYGPDQGRYLTELDQHQDNLRSAIEWSLSAKEGEAALRLAVALSRYWLVRAHLHEGRTWIETALQAAPGAAPSLRGRSLLGAGRLQELQGDFLGSKPKYVEALQIFTERGDRAGMGDALVGLGAALDWGEEKWAEGQDMTRRALALFEETGNRRGMARAYHRLANIACRLGKQTTDGQTLFEQALAAAQDAGESRAIGGAMNALGQLALMHRDLKQARQLFDEGIALLRGIGDPWMTAQLLGGVAQVAQDEGDYEAAGAYLEEAIGIARKIGARSQLSYFFAKLGWNLLYLGDTRRAEQNLEESHALAQSSNRKSEMPASHQRMAYLALYRGDAAAARRHATDALALVEELGDLEWIAWGKYLLALVAEAAGDIDEARQLGEEAEKLGRQSEVWWTVAGIDLFLARMERIAGDHQRAAEHAGEAMTLYHSNRVPKSIRDSVREMAAIGAVRGDFEKAAELLGAADVLPTHARTPYEQNDYDRTVATIKQALAPEVFEAAWQRGRKMWPDAAVESAMRLVTGNELRLS